MERVTLKKALEISFEKIKQIDEFEIIPITDGIDRVLHEDVKVLKNLPSYDNSAMDGYAYKYSQKDSLLKIKKTIFAGDIVEASLAKNECYKIMTGAKVPNDVDTIAPFEVCEENNGYVRIKKELKQGSNIRKKAEECKKGEVLLQKGKKLNFADIALLSSQGITFIKVYKKLKIAIISSGNEIKEPWQEASEDEVFNANGFGLLSFFKKYGFEANYVGSLEDDLHSTIKYIKSLSSYDAIITTGGMSKGEADFVYKAFLENNFKSFFHGISIKPGHPTTVGLMNRTIVIGLPGNPLASLLIAFSVALPILRHFQGEIKKQHNMLYAKMDKEIKLKPNRVNIVLGNVEDGIFKVINNGKINSAMLTQLTSANAIYYSNEDDEVIKENDLIRVVLL